MKKRDQRRSPDNRKVRIIEVRIIEVRLYFNRLLAVPSQSVEPLAFVAQASRTAYRRMAKAGCSTDLEGSASGDSQ